MRSLSASLRGLPGVYNRRVKPVQRIPSPKTRNSDSKHLAALDAELRAAGAVRQGRAAIAARRPAPRRVATATVEALRPAEPVPVAAANGAEWLAVPGWQRDRWLWAGFSTRRGGVSRAYCAEGEPGELNLGFMPDDERALVEENRARLAEAVTGSRETPLVPVRQFHSNVVVRITAEDVGRAVPWKAGAPGDRSTSLGWKADGAITDVPGILLGVQTADCIPVLVADRKRRVVGAFHAGWRGTVKRIVELGVGRMRLEFGSQPEDLVAAIGPGVGPCCYAVGEDVVREFESQFAYGSGLFRAVAAEPDPVRERHAAAFMNARAPGHAAAGPALHVNLVEANRRQLLDAGLRPRAIRVTGGCTQCHGQLFFSHRGGKGRAGRLMAVIGVRAD